MECTLARRQGNPQARRRRRPGRSGGLRVPWNR